MMREGFTECPGCGNPVPLVNGRRPPHYGTEEAADAGETGDEGALCSGSEIAGSEISAELRIALAPETDDDEAAEDGSGYQTGPLGDGDPGYPT